MGTNVKKDGAGKSKVPETYKQSMQENVITPKTIETDKSKASGKAKMNFSYPPLMPEQDNKEAGKMKTRAYSPGLTTPGS